VQGRGWGSGGKRNEKVDYIAQAEISNFHLKNLSFTQKNLVISVFYCL